jgi:signal transduction histidine kinase
MRLEKAVTVLNDAIQDLRRNLGELQTTPTHETLTNALRRLAEDPRFRSLVDVSLDLALPDSATLTPTRTHHVLAIVGEALANVVRHAQAQRVTIAVRQVAHQMTITIHDDGVGLPRDERAGYGLRNMRDRARLLGGVLEMTSASGKGTTVHLSLLWQDEH